MAEPHLEPVAPSDSQPLSVLVLTPWMSREGGGLQSAVRDMVLALHATTAFRYRVLSLRDRHSDEDLASWGPLPPVMSPFLGPDNFRFSPSMLGQALQGNDACVHQHGLWMFPSLVLRAHRLLKGKPVVISPHGMLDPWILSRGRWKKGLVGAGWEHSNWRGARAFRALTEEEATAIRKVVPRAKVFVIPNGVALPALDDALHTECDREPLRAAGKRLLYLGRLHEKKGIHLLLQAWALMRQQPDASDAVLRICGWGDEVYTARCKALAEELELGPSVVFVGPVFGVDKDRELASCSAMVLPSFSEGLPMVILEAWSHGRPTLMTNECNLEIGFTRGCAIRIATQPKSIVDGLRILFEMSESSRVAMGRSGRALVEREYSWADVARRTDAVTRWAIEGGSPPQL